MKRTNKIKACVSTDPETRAQMVRKLVVQLGFAMTPSDAGKIIRKSPHDFDMHSAYFVFAENYNLRESNLTTQRLYELAATGTAVVIGVRKLPADLEFLCEAYSPHDVGLW